MFPHSTWISALTNQIARFKSYLKETNWVSILLMLSLLGAVLLKYYIQAACCVHAVLSVLRVRNEDSPTTSVYQEAKALLIQTKTLKRVSWGVQLERERWGWREWGILSLIQRNDVVDMKEIPTLNERLFRRERKPNKTGTKRNWTPIECTCECVFCLHMTHYLHACSI